MTYSKSDLSSASPVDWYGFCVLGALAIIISSTVVICYLIVAAS